MVDVLTPEQRRRNMSQIRRKNTRPEKVLRSLLHRAGFRFRLHCKELPGSPDIVLPKYAAVVFVNGCFWHRHKDCRFSTVPATRTEFWLKKFADNVERDRQHANALRRGGWKVVVVWECELRKDAELVLRRVTKTLKGDC